MAVVLGIEALALGDVVLGHLLPVAKRLALVDGLLSDGVGMLLGDGLAGVTVSMAVGGERLEGAAAISRRGVTNCAIFD